MKVIDINCDVGEGLGNEALLMPYISSCNIACGGHAGNAHTMQRVIEIAMLHKVKIGAHPSYPDKENFGRRVMDISNDQLQFSIEQQLQDIISICLKNNIKLHHIKPHGALYNVAAVNKNIASVIIEAVKQKVQDAILYVPFNSVIESLAKEQGLKVMVEAFADRNYTTDLTLVSRAHPDALITDKNQLIRHLERMMINEEVIAIDGSRHKLKADTFCFHSDSPSAVGLLKYASEKLQETGIKVG